MRRSGRLDRRGRRATLSAARGVVVRLKSYLVRRTRNGSVEPYSLSCRSPTNSMVKMLDHPEKTARLLAELKAAVPFKVELTPHLIAYLRAQDVAAVDGPEHVVSDLSYAGDEGGIVCHIVPSNGGAAIIVSLTHVVVRGSSPLARAVLNYQKHRVKKLKKQDENKPRFYTTI